MAKMQLLTYTVMPGDYDAGNGKLMNVKGLEDAVPSTLSVAASVGTVDNPTQSGITIDPSKHDPVVFSFLYTPNPNDPGTKELRMLLATIVTPEFGEPSTECRYTLLKMNTNGDWTALGTKIQLVAPNKTTPWAKNPHGVAQIGNMLYILDYDTQMIYLLGGNELNGQATGSSYNPEYAPFNLASVLLNNDARAQALIALNDGSTDSLFALFLNCDAAGEIHDSGILVRVTVTPPPSPPPTPPPTLSVDAQTTVGKNPQMIIPVYPTSGSTILLIPAIGGKQENESKGNYGESNITKVPAFDAWSTPASAILVSDGSSSVPIPSVGAPTPTSYTFDIQAIAASGEADDNGIVYILSGVYNGVGEGVYDSKTFMLWKTTVNNLTLLGDDTLVSTAYLNGKLNDADTGTVAGFFWDIFYENKGTTGGQVGRLWFLRGSPIIVSPASDYNAGSKFFDRGTASGQIGGQNVNSVDLTAEIARQVQAGVSLRRGLRAHKPSIRAAKAAPTVGTAAEEEE